MVNLASHRGLPYVADMMLGTGADAPTARRDWTGVETRVPVMTAMFTEIMERYPPNLEVEAEGLADQFMVAFEGGFVMNRSMDDPKQLAKALEHYRNYVELLFRRP